MGRWLESLPCFAFISAKDTTTIGTPAECLNRPIDPFRCLGDPKKPQISGQMAQQETLELTGDLQTSRD